MRRVPLGSFLTLEIRKSPNLAQHLRLTARNRKKGEEGNREKKIYKYKICSIKTKQKNYLL